MKPPDGKETYTFGELLTPYAEFKEKRMQSDDIHKFVGQPGCTFQELVCLIYGVSCSRMKPYEIDFENDAIPLSDGAFDYGIRAVAYEISCALAGECFHSEEIAGTRFVKLPDAVMWYADYGNEELPYAMYWYIAIQFGDGEKPNSAEQPFQPIDMKISEMLKGTLLTAEKIASNLEEIDFHPRSIGTVKARLKNLKSKNLIANDGKGYYLPTSPPTLKID